MDSMDSIEIEDIGSLDFDYYFDFIDSFIHPTIFIRFAEPMSSPLK